MLIHAHFWGDFEDLTPKWKRYQCDPKSHPIVQNTSHDALIVKIGAIGFTKKLHTYIHTNLYSAKIVERICGVLAETTQVVAAPHVSVCVATAATDNYFKYHQNPFRGIGPRGFEI